MGIYIGTAELSKLYIGTQEVDKVYVGTEMVWQNTIEVDKPASLTPSGTYTGSVITNGYVCPAGVECVGNASGTNAGTYTATYTPDEDHEWSDGTGRVSVTVTLTITRASVGAKPSSASVTYNGSEQTNGYTKPNGVTMTGDAKGTSAGTYTAVYTPDSNHCWSDSTTSAVTVTLTIARASVGAKPATPSAVTYDGSAHSNGYVLPQYVTMTGDAGGTNAGTYTATYEPDTNHCWSDSTYAAVSITLTVNKAAGQITAPTANSLTYTGEALTLVQAGASSTGTVMYKVGTGSYSADLPQKLYAGEYTVYYYSAGDANHNNTAESSVTVTIAKKSLAIPYLSNTSKTYNGAEQSVTVNGYDSSWETQSGASSTDAGSKTVTWSLRDTSNTQWADGTTADKTATWAIAQATINDFALTASSKAYTGSALSVTVDRVKSGSLSATYSTSGTWSATNGGTYTATVTGTGNFNGSLSASWSILYYWNKYTVGVAYAERATLCTSQYYSPWGTIDYGYVTWWNTARASFDTTTGLYSFSGTARLLGSNMSSRGVCFSPPHSGSTAITSASSYAYTSSASSYGWGLNSNKVIVLMSGNQSAYYYDSVSSESRGTYVGQASSTSNIYPENGKSDGYWYVKAW